MFQAAAAKLHPPGSSHNPRFIWVIAPPSILISGLPPVNCVLVGCWIRKRLWVWAIPSKWSRGVASVHMVVLDPCALGSRARHLFIHILDT